MGRPRKEIKTEEFVPLPKTPAQSDKPDVDIRWLVATGGDQVNLYTKQRYTKEPVQVIVTGWELVQLESGKLAEYHANN